MDNYQLFTLVAFKNKIPKKTKNEIRAVWTVDPLRMYRTLNMNRNIQNGNKPYIIKTITFYGFLMKNHMRRDQNGFELIIIL